MEQPPKGKSTDELRAEELRQAAERAREELRQAREALVKETEEESKEKTTKKWGPLPESPYMALGVLPGATAEEVKVAYREMVKKYFPDQPGLSPAEKEEAGKWMQIVNEAKEALLNPNFTPTYFKEYAVRQRIEENAGKREEEVRMVRRPDDRMVKVPGIPPILPQQPPILPPKPPTPTPAPVPKAPQQSLWDRWKRRILIGLGVAVAGGVATEGGKRIFAGGKEPTPKEPVPAVSSASTADIEAIKARMALFEAERARAINQNTNTNTNTVNIERGGRREKRADRESRASTVQEEAAAQIKAQADELARLKAQTQNQEAELARIRAKLAEGKQLTADEAMIHNQNIQRNYPKSVNMGGYVVPGKIPE